QRAYNSNDKESMKITKLKSFNFHKRISNVMKPEFVLFCLCSRNFFKSSSSRKSLVLEYRRVLTT
ncbi:hypothetical protein L9F63_025840, partial [Diploptera punctata]